MSRILLVEDVQYVSEVQEELLRYYGYDVVTASTAALALQELEKTKFDVLFSDIRLAEGMSGVALASEADRRWPQMAIVLTTGYAFTAGDAANRWTTIRKPAMINDIVAALEAAIATKAAT